jgi:transcriptional regulator GlxA family with amidase domain
MLLRDSELSLAQIAHAVGFTGAAQLARVFCQHTGVPPGTYRSH